MKQTNTKLVKFELHAYAQLCSLNQLLGSSSIVQKALEQFNTFKKLFKYPRTGECRVSKKI